MASSVPKSFQVCEHCFLRMAAILLDGFLMGDSQREKKISKLLNQCDTVIKTKILKPNRSNQNLQCERTKPFGAPGTENSCFCRLSIWVVSFGNQKNINIRTGALMCPSLQSKTGRIYSCVKQRNYSIRKCHMLAFDLPWPRFRYGCLFLFLFLPLCLLFFILIPLLF